MTTTTKGYSHRAIRARIEEMAVGIARFGASDTELHNPTDINHGEDAEIKAARALAAIWIGRDNYLYDAGDVWHVYTGAAKEVRA
jgi:hypothetical protein